MSASNIALLSKNLDQHLVYPILEFLEKRGNNVAEAKKYVIGKTSRFGDAAALHAGDDAKLAKIEKLGEKFAEKYTKAIDNAKQITDEFFKTENEEFRLKKLQGELEEDRKNGLLSAQELYSSKKITQASIAALYELAFLSFDAGFYTQAAEMLYLYLAISSKKDSDANEVSATWGKLVCDSLSGSYSSAMDGVDAIRALQAQTPGSVTTVARSWLLHHSLFAYFKRIGATQIFLDHVIDFSTYLYANTIEVHSPHLIRYLAAAAILNRKRRSYLKRVTKIMEQESYNHSDVFAEFLLAMGESDFDKANTLIKSISTEAEGDYFLADLKDNLVNAAQMMVFDDYLKIHKTVSIPGVAEKLGMDVNKAEVWLVTLIQESKIEAEIDSVKQMITIQTAANAASQRSVHRSVLGKLENLSRPTN